VAVSPLDPTEGMWPQLAAWAFVSISIVVAVYLTDKPYGPAALAGVAARTILLAIVAVATPRALVCMPPGLGADGTAPSTVCFTAWVPGLAWLVAWLIGVGAILAARSWRSIASARA
jgi:hypothetical protein